MTTNHILLEKSASGEITEKKADSVKPWDTSKGMHFPQIVETVTVERSRQYRASEGVPGVNYVTAHRVLGLGPLHLAIQRTDEKGTRWISAGPPDGRWDLGIFGDPLIGGVGTPQNGVRPTDNPDKNIILGVLYPPPGQTSAEHFEAMAAGAEAYCDCVDYSLFPEVMFEGTNSDGFVAGLVNTFGGTTDVDIQSFVGGAKPLPASQFGR